MIATCTKKRLARATSIHVLDNNNSTMEAGGSLKRSAIGSRLVAVAIGDPGSEEPKDMSRQSKQLKSINRPKDEAGAERNEDYSRSQADSLEPNKRDGAGAL